MSEAAACFIGMAFGFLIAVLAFNDNISKSIHYDTILSGKETRYSYNGCVYTVKNKAIIAEICEERE